MNGLNSFRILPSIIKNALKVQDKKDVHFLAKVEKGTARNIVKNLIFFERKCNKMIRKQNGSLN